LNNKLLETHSSCKSSSFIFKKTKHIIASINVQVVEWSGVLNTFTHHCTLREIAHRTFDRKTRKFTRSKSFSPGVTPLNYIIMNAAAVERPQETATGLDTLVHAAANNDTASVLALLLTGMHVDSPDEHGYTALMHAAFAGYELVVECLLEAGANIELADTGGTTALLAAVTAGQLRTAQLLLQAGANIDVLKNESTPLMWAARLRHSALVALLTEYGAKINHARNKNTALSDALQNSCAASVRVLCLAGADVYECVTTGRGLMEAAADRGDEASVMLLIASGAPHFPPTGHHSNMTGSRAPHAL
jgi:ankyrin repeat protein